MTISDMAFITLALQLISIFVMYVRGQRAFSLFVQQSRYFIVQRTQSTLSTKFFIPRVRFRFSITQTFYTTIRKNAPDSFGLAILKKPSPKSVLHYSTLSSHHKFTFSAHVTTFCYHLILPDKL